MFPWELSFVDGQGVEAVWPENRLNKTEQYAQYMCMNAQTDPIENWEEIRIAYHVARLGTLSAAAEHLGVHHATVIRHINALEERLGCKLFQRHPRGYTATEAGRDLCQVAAATEDQLTQLTNRMRGQSSSVSGELIITMLSYLSPQFTPLLVAFQGENPEVQINLVAGDRLLKLEHGEAHVALRVGPKPKEPDNVVQPLVRLPHALYAHKSYVSKFGKLKGKRDIPNHQFVGSNLAKGRGPTQIWSRNNVPNKAIVYRASERSIDDAVHAGAGIGFLSVWAGQSNPDLVQMMASKPEWDSVVWLVTHVDLHRTPKIQTLLEFLKSQSGLLITGEGAPQVRRRPR